MNNFGTSIIFFVFFSRIGKVVIDLRFYFKSLFQSTYAI